MPFIRKIEARAYVRATEIIERVSTAVLNVFPEEIKQNVLVAEEWAEGQAGDRISIITGVLDNSEDCGHTFNFILNNMEKSGRGEIRRSLDLRLNDNCVFFLRIDKQGAFLRKIRLANNADVIRLQIYFKDSPKCKPEDAMNFIMQSLQDTEV